MNSAEEYAHGALPARTGHEGPRRRTWTGRRFQRAPVRVPPEWLTHRPVGPAEPDSSRPQRTTRGSLVLAEKPAAAHHSPFPAGGRAIGRWTSPHEAAESNQRGSHRPAPFPGPGTAAAGVRAGV